MKKTTAHTFHIPVMGLGYTIDTPIKVGRFGISSVVSIIQDVLIEQMREYYCKLYGYNFSPIPVGDIDHRAKRVKAYLNLLKEILDAQVEKVRNESFEEGKDLVKYFKMLPEDSALKILYYEMTKMQGDAKIFIQRQLRKQIVAGAIDVNIMSKIDNRNYSKDGELLPVEYSDALSAFRGFAESDLTSSIIFSAGLNPRLFNLIEKYPQFYPDRSGAIKKRIVLKVSDFRSAEIQAKYLAKRGLWVSEFRVESGLNCGGHAFPTDGHLLGPILQEFKERKSELEKDLIKVCNQNLVLNKRDLVEQTEKIRVTVQGGIGTSGEDRLLREHYGVDGTGWGSPFLLVPEATNVDDSTLEQLKSAGREDYYLSRSSPLGIPFNNFRKSSSEIQRSLRIKKGRPGSPCYKKYLSFNTEFSEKPLCIASRAYQEKKIKSLRNDPQLTKDRLEKQIQQVMEKDCLCEGLSSAALQKHKIRDPHKLEAVVICPGPNLAYFSEIFTLEEMVGHIYGRLNILNETYRPHFFINELKMYVDYLKDEMKRFSGEIGDKERKYFSQFKENLMGGIQYYIQLLPSVSGHLGEIESAMESEFSVLLDQVRNLFPDGGLIQGSLGKLSF